MFFQIPISAISVAFEILDRHNQFSITQTGTDLVITDLHARFIAAPAGTTLSNSNNTLTVPLATVTSLKIYSNNGDDRVQLDTNGSIGDPIPALGILLNLGTGSDTLELINNSTTNIWNIAGKNSGKVDIGLLGTVKFGQLESVIGGAGTDQFRLNNTLANSMTLLDGGRGFQDQLQITRNANITLSDSRLMIVAFDAGQSNQTFGLQNIETATLIGGSGSNLLNALDFTLGSVTLRGLGGHDTLIGGSQADWLDGGAGNDILRGKRGNDILIGGLGNDQFNQTSDFQRDADDDILIGGTTDFDGNVPAREAILAAWNGPNTYLERITLLKTTGVGEGNIYKLNSDTVHDDNAVDQFYGGTGSDWFFARLATEDPDDTGEETTQLINV